MELLRFLLNCIIRFGRFVLTFSVGSQPKNIETATDKAKEIAPKPVRRQPLDGNPDWQQPESEEAKFAILGLTRGAEVDTYLWFELGDVESLTREETDAIVRDFFVSGKVSFGDIELHKSMMPGNPTVLRLRGNLRLHPALTLRNRYCPLYQVGHVDIIGRKMEGTCSFYRLWDLPQEHAA